MRHQNEVTWSLPLAFVMTLEALAKIEECVSALVDRGVVDASLKVHVETVRKALCPSDILTVHPDDLSDEDLRIIGWSEETIDIGLKSDVAVIYFTKWPFRSPCAPLCSSNSASDTLCRLQARRATSHRTHCARLRLQQRTLPLVHRVSLVHALYRRAGAPRCTCVHGVPPQ